MNSNLDYALAGARVSELQRHGHDGHDGEPWIALEPDPAPP